MGPLLRHGEPLIPTGFPLTTGPFACTRDHRDLQRDTEFCSQIRDLGRIRAGEPETGRNGDPITAFRISNCVCFAGKIYHQRNPILLLLVSRKAQPSRDCRAHCLGRIRSQKRPGGVRLIMIRMIETSDLLCFFSIELLFCRCNLLQPPLNNHESLRPGVFSRSRQVLVLLLPMVRIRCPAATAERCSKGAVLRLRGSRYRSSRPTVQCLHS